MDLTPARTLMTTTRMRGVLCALTLPLALGLTGGLAVSARDDRRRHAALGA